jgi:hypothetical protein
MRNFLLGYGAGILTYHYISGGFKNDELISEMRGMIKKLDDRLAAQTPTTPTEPTTSTADVDEPLFTAPKHTE